MPDIPRLHAKKKLIDSTGEKHTQTAFGVKILSSQHKEIRQLKRHEKAPSIHGNKFWGSSYLLMDFLQHNPPEKNYKILELGCGWGLAGIHCAKYYQSTVVAVDADGAVFPYLHLHAEHNSVKIDTWEQRFEDIDLQHLEDIDMIIASDVCFWDELSETLYRLIMRACEAGVSRIVITDPERPPFFTLAERCMEEFYGELFEWKIDEPRRASGCILLIENA
ncbi:MAG: putative nicotinamide N-methyase [Oceanicoccus sp.]|jgi:predicted nicotinamide N-methyase